MRDPALRLPALILFILAALIPSYTWHENSSGFLTDDGMYLLMADFFSPWFDGNIYVDFLVMKNARFPPAFPVLIALFGGGSENMAAAHLITGICFIVSALLLYIWARRNLLPPELAVACLLVYTLLPETWIYVLELRSEFLYMALVLSTLVVLDIGRQSKRHEREMLCLAAILAGLATTTRTIGVSLFAALLIYLFVNRIERKWLYLAIAVALPVAWYAIKAFNGYSNLYVEDVMRYTDYEGFRRLITTDLPRNAWSFFTSWNANLAGDDNSWIPRGAAALLLPPALVGFVHRLRQHRPDTHYVIFYVAIILVWPHPDHMVRFVYPLVPIALLYVFCGVSVAVRGRRALSEPLIHAGVTLLILAMVYPNILALINRYHTPFPNYVPEDFRQTRSWLRADNLEEARAGADLKHSVIALLQRVPRHLKPDECLYTDHVPLTMLYAHRPARRIPSDLSPRRLAGCKYVFVMNLIGNHEGKYPLTVIDHERLGLVDIQYDHSDEQQAYLFRIRK